MKRVVTLLKKNWDVCAVMFLMFGFFSYIMFYCHADLPLHAKDAKLLFEQNKLFSGAFLLYFLLNLLSGFSGNEMVIKWMLVSLIAASIVAKYIIVEKSFKELFRQPVAKITSALLLVVYIIPYLYFMKWFGYYKHMDNMYLGYFVPNVWHNSTIICMMPFAILAYLLSIKQLCVFSRKRNRLLVLCVVAATLIKPSFFFVYCVGYTIVLVVKYRFKKEFFYSLVPLLCGGLCVVYEYLSIYLFSSPTDSSGSHVVINANDLFSIDYWKSNFLYYVSSFSFPLLFVIVYRKQLLRDMEFWLVFIMMGAAMGIMWLCHETGLRANDGNFMWQVFVAMWFVYYYMIKVIIRNDLYAFEVDKFSDVSFREKCRTMGVRGWCFVTLYAIHVMMGLLYMCKYVVSRTFW